MALTPVPGFVWDRLESSNSLSHVCMYVCMYFFFFFLEVLVCRRPLAGVC